MNGKQKTADRITRLLRAREVGGDDAVRKLFREMVKAPAQKPVDKKARVN